MRGRQEQPFIHATAHVEADVVIGGGTRIWHQAQIRRGARLGERCNIGKGVFIDFDVVIGDDCKLQNYTCVYHGTRIGRGVFVGPHVVFANDERPRAVASDLRPLSDGDWTVGVSIVDDGAAIGANATILPNVRIGRWAMVGAGAVVTRNVPDYGLAVGSPARFVCWICSCGRRIVANTCSSCGDPPPDHPAYQNRITPKNGLE